MNPAPTDGGRGDEAAPRTEGKGREGDGREGKGRGGQRRGHAKTNANAQEEKGETEMKRSGEERRRNIYRAKKREAFRFACQVGSSVVIARSSHEENRCEEKNVKLNRKIDVDMPPKGKENKIRENSQRQGNGGACRHIEDNTFAKSVKKEIGNDHLQCFIDKEDEDQERTRDKREWVGLDVKEHRTFEMPSETPSAEVSLYDSRYSLDSSDK